MRMAVRAHREADREIEITTPRRGTRSPLRGSEAFDQL